MITFLSRLALKLYGWKVVGEFPDGDKYVVLAAPHTSMWDFVWGRLYYNSIRKSVRFMIKDKYFFFPLGYWIKSLGALPVKIDGKTGLVKQMVDEYRKRDRFLLTITPEGTRSRVKRWKRGFYHIAKATQVPIVLGFIDYKKKELGILGSLHLLDNEDADLEKIRKVYENIGAKHPERYNKDSIK